MFLRQALGVEVLSHVISIGASAPYDGSPPQPEDLPRSTPARCAHTTRRRKLP
ncbi:chorismate synthase domain protein [Mycobacterium xenopi 4042]|uniref:Chorismate synthase domain protein n=1 Tax=Mycobacterium xenopi 4042 TaxID=1299334 RepID=X8DBA2_MYCXE|nr:chorismate synthase domain protein [Mycobacterium xenopi 4042]